MYSEGCWNQRISNVWDSFFKFLDRFIGYIAWLYPLIVIDWPTTKTKQRAINDKNAKKLAKLSQKNNFSYDSDMNRDYFGMEGSFLSRTNRESSETT